METFWDTVLSSELEKINSVKTILEVEIKEGEQTIIQNNIRRYYLRNTLDVIGNKLWQKSFLQKEQNPIVSVMMNQYFESYGTSLAGRGSGYTSFKKCLIPKYEEIKQLNIDIAALLNCVVFEDSEPIHNSKRYKNLNNLIISYREEEFENITYEKLSNDILPLIDKEFNKSSSLIGIHSLRPIYYLNDHQNNDIHHEFRISLFCVS